MSLPKPHALITSKAGVVPAQIVSVIDTAIMPAGTTSLHLHTCDDGTFLLAATKPTQAPVGVGFRMTREQLRDLMALIDGAT